MGGGDTLAGDREHRPDFGDIGGLVRILAESGAESAEVVKETARLDRRRFEAACRSIGVSPDDPTVALCRPPEYGVRRVTVAAKIRSTQRRSRELSVGLTVGGRLVHAFFQRRFASEEERFESLTVEVEHHEFSPPEVAGEQA